MLVVLERGRQAFELSTALHVDVLIGVDQDVAHARIAKQRLERTEAEHLVDHVTEDDLALGHAERRPFLGNEIEQQRANLRFRARAFGGGQRLEVQAVQQLAMNVRFQLEVLRPRCVGAPASRSRAWINRIQRKSHEDGPELEQSQERAPLLGLGRHLVVLAEDLP